MNCITEINSKINHETNASIELTIFVLKILELIWCEKRFLFLFKYCEILLIFEFYKFSKNK